MYVLKYEIPPRLARMRIPMENQSMEYQRRSMASKWMAGVDDSERNHWPQPPVTGPVKNHRVALCWKGSIEYFILHVSYYCSHRIHNCSSLKQVWWYFRLFQPNNHDLKLELTTADWKGWSDDGHHAANFARVFVQIKKIRTFYYVYFNIMPNLCVKDWSNSFRSKHNIVKSREDQRFEGTLWVFVKIFVYIIYPSSCVPMINIWNIPLLDNSAHNGSRKKSVIGGLWETSSKIPRILHMIVGILCCASTVRKQFSATLFHVILDAHTFLQNETGWQIGRKIVKY